MEELSKTKIEQLQRQPILETTITKTKDGKWVLHKTVITDIKPVKYYEGIMLKTVKSLFVQKGKTANVPTSPSSTHNQNEFPTALSEVFVKRSSRP